MTQRAGLFTEIDGHAASRVNLGEWCLREGLATAEQLELCLRVQRDRLRAGGPAPRLGEILVERGILTPQQVAEGLAQQQQEIRLCPRCAIRINVPRRSDAAAYRCPRCQEALQPSSPSDGLGVVDDPAIVVSLDPLPPDVAAASAVASNRFGKYVLLGEVGRGGVGSVHRAWDTLLSQVVALKRLAPAAGDEPTPMFGARAQSLLKEARHAIRLRHPGIISVYDVGVVGRDYYISMEYLEAESLHDRIQDARGRGRSSPYFEKPREVLRILSEVARAVHYAHTRPAPIIHCDLKPGNILIDREGHAHVVDFGIARNLQAQAGGPGEICGTPSYMAPEQCAGEAEKIDARTDVYGFGAVLYEMLAGRPPFVGVPIEILERTMRQEPPSPSEALRDSERPSSSSMSTKRLLRIPPVLEEICLRCLRKAREDRPASLLEVADVLEKAAGLKAPDAFGPGKAPGPVRRRRWILAAAAVAAAVAAVTGPAALRRPEPWTSAERQIHALLGEFRPEAALPLAEDLRSRSEDTQDATRASLLVEEAGWISQFKDRLVRIAPADAALPDLRLRSGSKGPVRLAALDPARLRVKAGEELRDVPWEDLSPGTLVDVAERLLPEMEPADRLALAIVCLRAGDSSTAQRLLASLRLGTLRVVVERYLAKID